jgi:hypothetical protein
MICKELFTSTYFPRFWTIFILMFPVQYWRFLFVHLRLPPPLKDLKYVFFRAELPCLASGPVCKVSAPPPPPLHHQVSTGHYKKTETKTSFLQTLLQKITFPLAFQLSHLTVKLGHRPPGILCINLNELSVWPSLLLPRIETDRIRRTLSPFKTWRAFVLS